jgi:hypothetical protein
MEQVKETTFEALSSAWEQAWVSYSTVVQQLKEYGSTAIETATAEYELAKKNLAERTKELQTWIIENGQMMRDDPKSAEIETAYELHKARKEAFEKYIHSKDDLRRVFLVSQEEAKDNVRDAQEQVRKTSLNLEKHLKNSSDIEAFRNTKMKLEKANSKAQKELEESRAHIRSLYGNISSWSKEVEKILSEQSEFLSQRVLQMRDQLFDKTTKAKVEEVKVEPRKIMSERWEEIFNSLKDEYEYALDKMTQAQNSVPESLEAVLEPTDIIESQQISQLPTEKLPIATSPAPSLVA